jgi:hypothetical protein
VYTASVPANVFFRNSTSSTEPIAAMAPWSVNDLIFSALRLMTVTSCPAFNNFSASGFEILPAAPVITYLMILRF